jgi:hypothetical protein
MEVATPEASDLIQRSTVKSSKSAHPDLSGLQIPTPATQPNQTCLSLPGDGKRKATGQELEVLDEEDDEDFNLDGDEILPSPGGSPREYTKGGGHRQMTLAEAVAAVGTSEEAVPTVNEDASAAGPPHSQQDSAALAAAWYASAEPSVEHLCGRSAGGTVVEVGAASLPVDGVRPDESLSAAVTMMVEVVAVGPKKRQQRKSVGGTPNKNTEERALELVSAPALKGLHIEHTVPYFT